MNSKSVIRPIRNGEQPKWESNPTLPSRFPGTRFLIYYLVTKLKAAVIPSLLPRLDPGLSSWPKDQATLAEFEGGLCYLNHPDLGSRNITTSWPGETTRSGVNRNTDFSIVNPPRLRHCGIFKLPQKSRKTTNQCPRSTFFICPGGHKSKHIGKSKRVNDIPTHVPTHVHSLPPPYP